MTPKAWSFSALSGFLTCARQYYEMSVAKNYPYVQGPEAKWGDRVHKMIEDHVGNKINLENEEGMTHAMTDRVLGILDELTDSGCKLVAEGKTSLNRNLKPCGYFDKDTWLRGVLDLLAFHPDNTTATIIDWKGLPLDTPLATPKGMTTMGAVSVGDKVIGGDGKPCTVRGKSEIHNRDCYKLIFDDASVGVCDDEHLWKLLDGRVVPITEVRICDYMPLSKPWRLKKASLPIDPYVFGLWLADGKHTSSEVSKPDDQIWEEVVRRGYEISHDYTAKKPGLCRTHTIKGIRKHLVSLGVFGNKHIPMLYLRASHTQRLDLLRGLMDGDGNANTTRKQAVFTSCSKILSDNVKELLLTLGQRPCQSDVIARGFGVVTRAYPVSFRPLGINPFLLDRKASRIDPAWGAGRSDKRRVVSIEKVDSVPTQCISVDSVDNTYLCTDNMLVTHNTGKVKPDIKQLKLFAILVFYHYPAIQVVHTRFEWLAYNDSTSETYHRKDLNKLWSAFLPDLKKLREAFLTDSWPAKKSGLCQKYCDVTACEHNGRNR